MKKMKNGFSLAEILVALGIVSVIATLGFSISKKGIARAYDAYVYNGLNSISAIMTDASAQGIEGGSTNLYKHIAKHLDTAYKDTDQTITAPNNVKYTFKDPAVP